MRTIRQLLLLPTLVLVSLIFGCEKDPVATGKEKPEFTISNTSPTVGEDITLTANVKTSETEFVTWIIEGHENKGTPLVIKVKKAGELKITLKIKYVDDNRLYESSKTITVHKTAVVTHSQEINKDELWKNNQIHIVDGRINIKNATLTIEAGTVVKFKENSGLELGITQMQTSKLIAKGNAEARIVFTSAKETPKPKDWDYIKFGKFADTSSIMEYCEISCAGGYSNYSGSIVLENIGIKFNNNVVKKSGSNGIVCNTGAFFKSFENNEVKECTGNAVTISANYAHTLGSKQNTPSRIDNNSLHGIYISGGNLETKDSVVWQNLGSRYTISDRLDVGSADTTTLIIEKGCTLSFRANAGLKIGEEANKTGRLIAKGNENAKINFIPEKVGSSSQNWDFIAFGEYAADSSVLEHCIIEGAGGFSDHSAALIVEKTSIICNNIEIKKSASNGIKCSKNGHFVEFSNNMIYNSKSSSITMEANWVHTIGYNNRIANNGLGIAVTGNEFNHEGGEFHWKKQTCPYTITDTLNIGSKQGCTLVIRAGNVIQFAENKGLTVGKIPDESGKLIAQGTNRNTIKFAPATKTGSWSYLNFQAGTELGSKLIHCNIIKAGSNRELPYAVICRADAKGTPVIHNCLIKDSKSNGLERNSNANVKNVSYQNIAGKNEKILNE